MKRSPISKISKVCGFCKKEFDAAKRRPDAKFCSFWCKEDARRERRRCGKARFVVFHRKKNRKRLKTCVVCKLEFIQRHMGAKTCSRRCWLEYCQSLITEKLCVQCNKPFMPRDLYEQRHKKLCGNDCRKAYLHGDKTGMYRDGRGHYRGRDWPHVSSLIRERDKHCRALIHDPSREQKRERLNVDHIVSYGLIVKFCPKKNPNEHLNLIGMCRVCHAFKTAGPESKLERGDILGFISGMARILDRGTVLRALEFYGFA